MEVAMRSFVLFVALVLTGAVASAASFNPPKRKSGLWEIKILNAKAKGAHTVQQCVDEKTDDLMKNEAAGMENLSCSKNEIRKEGDKIIAESICKMDGSTAKTRAIFTGRFDSAYKADVRSTYEPPMAGTREALTVIEARWLGPCKSGQKPGDISIPGMPDINEMMKKGMPKKQ
jgi:hypothetical protein